MKRGKDNINLINGYVQEDGFQPKFRRRRKDNKQVSEYFRFIFFKNPVHKTGNRVLAGLMLELDNLYI